MAGDVPPGARAVRFDRYGGTDELYIADVAVPVPGPGRVVVEVRATAVNPGESAIRRGLLHDRFPATFPSGQGSDLAGVVVAVGPDAADVEVGAEVLGWSWERSAHATHVAVPVTQLIARPPQLPWTVAGALYVISAAATAAIAAVEPQPGETVVVSAAAGGVGSLVVQLLALNGVSVLAIASPQRDDWLRAHGAVPVHRGDHLGARLRAAAPRGIDAVIDLFGPEYVQLGIDLGVARDRIETIISFAAAQEHGTRALGSEDATSTGTLRAITDLVAAGRLEVPIAGTYPLHEVAAAFDELEQRRTHGKIVLLP